MKALLSFIETTAFTRRVLEYLSDEDYAELQKKLVEEWLQ
jgi:hypothetical protein